MIRLPDASAVGPTPNANSGRPIATVDLSGGARGLQQLGQGMQQAADAGFRVAETFKEDIDKQKAWDTATRWQNFQNNWKTKAQGMADSMQPGGVGTMDAFKNDYRADARKFYSTIPENLKGAYRPQILDYEGALGGTLNASVIKEKNRYAGDQQTQMDNTFVNEAAANPTDPNAAKAAAEKIKTYTLANPNLSPVDKQTRLADVPNTVARGLGAAIVANKDSVRQVFQPGQAGDTWQAMLQKENASGDPAAKSSAGALGVAQVLPGTAREVAKKLGLTNVAGMDDQQMRAYFAAHPEVNHQIGKAYFDEQVTKYNGDQEAAVIAYNAGPGVADKWIASGRNDAMLPKETQAYKADVLKNSGGDAEEEAPENMPDASSLVPNNAKPDTIGLGRYLAAGKGMEHINGMQKPLQQGLQAMFDAAPPEIQKTLRIMSGYRSPERQKQLWDAAVAKYGSAAVARKWVAPPGNSQHNHGNAADLSFDGAGTTAKLSPAGQAAMQWVHANAGRFGLAFPLGNEPWHVEVAGARGKGGASTTPSADPYSTARTYFQRQFGDTVDPNVLNQLANAAVTARNQFNAESRQLITQVSQDAPTAIANSGRYTGTMPSRQDFDDAFGREAPQKYAAFQAGLQTAQSAFDMGTQSDADVKSTVAAAKAKMDATTGEGAALAASQYDMVAKAAEAALKARSSDIVGYTQQHFPNVKTAWETYAANPSADALSNAIGATTAAQAQLGTKGTDQAVLPSNIVDDFVARTKQPTRTTEQNMQDLAGLVFATNDPDQQQAIFNQLRKAGVPAEAETVLRAYGRQDKASARFLAAVIDAKSLPEKKEPGQIDSVANAVDQQMSDPTSGIAQTLYGMDIGQEGNLETYTTDRNVFIKGVKVKMLEGMAKDDAVKFVGKALYGDARVVDQGNAKIVTTGQQNDEAIIQGLSHQSGAIKQALSSYGLVHGMDGTPEERNSKAVIERLNQFRISDIMANGTWRNVGNGFGFVDNATGLFVGGKDGKPIVITPDRAEAEGLLRQSAAETVKKNLSATPVPPVNAPPPGNSPANVRPQSEFQPSANMDGLGFNPPAPKQDSLMDFIPADQKAGPVPSMDSILKPEAAD